MERRATTILKPGITPRVRRLLEGFHAAQPEVFAERAVLVTQAYEETEGQPIALRRAAALERVLEGTSVLIRDGELIVGCKTPAVLGSPLYPEIACDWVEDELDTIALRPEAPFALSDGTKEALGAHVFGYWKGKQVCDRIVEALPPDVLRATDAGLFFHYYMNRSIGHITVDYRAVLEKGFLGLRDEVRCELEKPDHEQLGILRKIHQLRAMERCCDAAVRFSERYAAEAAEMAAMDGHPVRRAELAEIARVCARVPAHPATTFHEALQSFWLVHLILNLETNSYAISPGRFDQYLYPYYAADLAAGRLTREGARELLSCLWLKLNELTVVKEGGTAKASTTYNDFQNLNVGGLLADGRDAVNDLSYLCVEVGRTAATAPAPGVRAGVGEDARAVPAALLPGDPLRSGHALRLQRRREGGEHAPQGPLSDRRPSGEHQRLRGAERAGQGLHGFERLPEPVQVPGVGAQRRDGPAHRRSARAAHRSP